MLYRLLPILVFAMVTGPGGAWGQEEAESETETETETETEAETEAGTEAESEAETEAESETEAETEAETEPVWPVLPPVLLERPVAVFPDEALAAGVEGMAVLRLDITAEGTVEAVTVVRDPGHGLGAAAEEVARGSRYEPANQRGLPVPFANLYATIDLDHEGIEPPPLPTGEMADHLTRAPEPVETPAAVYPHDLKEAGVEGVVQMEILIDPRGRVTNVRLLGSAGAAFDVAARDAAWNFRFLPGYAGDIPVPVNITYDYVFRLEERVVESVAETGYDAVDPEGPENLVGIVRERGTRNPMPDVEVHIEEFDLGVTSGPDGRFAFQGIPVGTWHMLILAPGYEPFRTEEDILQGQLTDVVYFVRPSPVGLNRTVVRVKKERKEVSRTTLTIEEIQQVAGTFGDPIKVVQNLPGVARSPFDFGLLVVRGSGPEDTGEYVDGIRVPLLYHFGGFRSVITPIMIDSIDFYPGGYSVRWGRTTGGVMNVSTRREWPDQVHGLARVDLLDAEAAVVGPFKKDGNKVGGFGVAGRRSYIDLVLPALTPPSLDLSNTVLPQWWDAQIKLALSPSPRVDLWTYIYASDDQTSTTSDRPSSAQFADSTGFAGFRTSFFRATAGGALRPHDALTVDWTFGYSYDAIRMSLGSAFGAGTASDFYYGRAEATWAPEEWGSAHLGFDYAGGTNRFEIFTSATEQLLAGDPTQESESLVIIGDIAGHAPALYLEGVFTPLMDDRLKIIPGLRFDHYWLKQGTSFQSWDPRLALRIQVHENTVLKGAVGLFHQNPQPWEFFEGIGNPDLDPESSPQVVVGIEQQFTPFLGLDAQFFYKSMDNLVVAVIDDASSAEDVWRNGGVGKVIGGEFFLRWKPHRNFMGWVSYTVSNSTRRDQPGDDWYLFEFDQPHILDVVASYQFPYEITVGFRFRLVSGNPTTPYMGAMFDSDVPGYMGLFGEYNSRRMPAFHQLDVRFEKEFIFRRWRLQAYLEIMNIYNRQNPEFEIYNFDYTEKDYLNGLPFIPNLGLRAEF